MSRVSGRRVESRRRLGRALRKPRRNAAARGRRGQETPMPGPALLRRALGAFVGVRVAGETLVLRDLLLARPSSAREVAVDHARALAALVDRPHDQRLAAAGVTRGEHAVHRGRVWARPPSTLPRGSRSTPSCSSSPCSGPRKPIASSTSCAGSSRSVPGTGANGGARLGLGDLQRATRRRPRRREGCRRDREVLLAHASSWPPPSHS